MIVFYFIFVGLMILYAVLIAFYHRHWNKVPVDLVAGSLKNPGLSSDDVAQGILELSSLTPTQQLKISVIIPMRNESENIRGLLSSLKNQDYPAELTEIILVDDHSVDNTWELISSEIAGNIKAIRLQDLPRAAGGSFKKQAIAAGIRLATGRLIVTSDADCSFDPGWLSTIASWQSDTGSIFIAAPVRLRSQKTILSVFETLDFLTLQGITAASVSARFHTMCNGANLAYTTEAFYEVNGFDGIDHIPSGDDMLLMYKIYKRYPDKVSYLKHQSAIVDTSGSPSLRAFFNQRIRWASKAVHYDDKRIIGVLFLVYLVNLCFLVAGIASFWKMNNFIFFFLMLVAKVLIEFPFVNSVAMFFGQQRLMRYFSLFQPIHIIYTIVAGWLGKFGSYEWKGRKISNHDSTIKGA